MTIYVDGCVAVTRKDFYFFIFYFHSTYYFGRDRKELKGGEFRN
jgi:hypothetical protein